MLYQGALARPSLWNSTPLGSAPVRVQRLRARYSYSAVPTRMLRWGSALRLKGDVSMSVHSIRVQLEPAHRLNMLYQSALPRPFALEFNPAGVRLRWCAAFTRRHSYSAIPTRMLRWSSALRPKSDGAVSVRSIRVRLEIGTRFRHAVPGCASATLRFGIQPHWGSVTVGVQRLRAGIAIR